MSKRTRSAKPKSPIGRSDEKITHSVIVPAYKEHLNIAPLTTRLFAALADSESPVSADVVELLIVDDNSRDGTVEVVEQLRQQGFNVRVILRATERGLSSAVLRGFQEASGHALLCMDADLQVPCALYCPKRVMVIVASA
jgi:dolichol-phosphate mannosyltransferase